MKSKRTIFLPLLLLLVIAPAARADKVDDYVKSAMEKQHIPGAAVAVVKDGKIVKAEGYGIANIELNVPVRPDTVFKIGSVSKQFISAGILMLAQEGKLSLDDPITRFLPEVCAMRRSSPCTWIEKISAHRASRVDASDGT